MVSRAFSIGGDCGEMETCYEAKVSKIFQQFDGNRDGVLSRDEVEALFIAINPMVEIIDKFFNPYIDNILDEYGEIVDGKEGLRYTGLLLCYYDGEGNVDRDYATLVPNRKPNEDKDSDSSSKVKDEVTVDPIDDISYEPINKVITESIESHVNDCAIGLTSNDLEIRVEKNGGNVNSCLNISSLGIFSKAANCLIKCPGEMMEGLLSSDTLLVGSRSSLELFWDPGGYMVNHRQIYMVFSSVKEKITKRNRTTRIHTNCSIEVPVEVTEELLRLGPVFGLGSSIEGLWDPGGYRKDIELVYHDRLHSNTNSVTVLAGNLVSMLRNDFMLNQHSIEGAREGCVWMECGTKPNEVRLTSLISVCASFLESKMGQQIQFRILKFDKFVYDCGIGNALGAYLIYSEILDTCQEAVACTKVKEDQSIKKEQVIIRSSRCLIKFLAGMVKGLLHSVLWDDSLWIWYKYVKDAAEEGSSFDDVLILIIGKSLKNEAKYKNQKMILLNWLLQELLFQDVARNFTSTLFRKDDHQFAHSLTEFEVIMKQLPANALRDRYNALLKVISSCTTHLSPIAYNGTKLLGRFELPTLIIVVAADFELAYIPQRLMIFDHGKQLGQQIIGLPSWFTVSVFSMFSFQHVQFGERMTLVEVFYLYEKKDGVLRRCAIILLHVDRWLDQKVVNRKWFNLEKYVIVLLIFVATSTVCLVSNIAISSGAKNLTRWLKVKNKVAHDVSCKVHGASVPYKDADSSLYHAMWDVKCCCRIAKLPKGIG